MQEDSGLYMAAWQCGWPCRGIQGNGPSTDFQALEKFNGDLKRSLPAQFHRFSLSTVTPRIESGIRSLMKGRNWVSDLEDETTIESHIVHSDTVHKKLLSGWSSQPRLEHEDRAGLYSLIRMFLDLHHCTTIE